MMVAFRARGRAVFVYGFAKNERDNIDPDELESLRDFAAGWLAADDEKMTFAVSRGVLYEVSDDDE